MKKLLLFLLLPLLAVAQLPRLPQQGQFTPSFVLDLTKGTLPSSFTCTRAGTATRFNALGQLETVAANAPRFDYDPTTYQNMNLIAPSEDYSGGIWSRTGSTVSQTAVTAPIAASVTLLTETTATSGHTLTGSNVSTAICTFSIYAKAAGRNFLWLYFGGYSGGSTWFDLASGTAVNVEGNVTAAIVNLGDGWYRCSITKKNAQNHSSVAANLANSSTATSYTGDGVSGILLTGAQLETGTVVGPYTKTTTLPVTTTTLATLKGLLIEDSRTNFVRNSEMVGAVTGTPGTLPTNWAIDQAYGSSTVRSRVAVVSELGITCVDIGLSGTTTTGNYLLVNPNGANYPCTVGQRLTFSVYVRLAGGAMGIGAKCGVQAQFFDSGNAQLSSNNSTEIDVPTGLTKLSYTTGAAPANATSCRFWIYFTGAQPTTVYTFALRFGAPQVEVGSFPSSYIPTTGSSVQRNADFVQTSTLNWFNPKQGTIVTEILTPIAANTTSNQGIFSINTGTATPRIDCRYPFTFFLNTTSISNGTGLASTIQRVSTSYRSTNYMAVSVGGGVPTTATPATYPTGLNRLQLGTLDGGASNALNGHVRRLYYYPTVVPTPYFRKVSQ
ncbi:phage head spike fiber domain-containing protein [Fibrella aestuarina]|nr:hypothetical protein [Fibrella aestuarina]